MAEPGEDGGGERAARVGHLLPTGPAVGGQRGALVRPVGRMDGCRFRHHHAGPTLGPGPVVGDVPFAQGAASTQIGHVGAEDHP